MPDMQKSLGTVELPSNRLIYEASKRTTTPGKSNDR